ncbi:outer membrane beta-barrel protein [Bradyrhizobium sp. LHD-71]|uniref:outer membrane beta-barrel protein n=1 Tax=Bradyrhizobium sp. LHD-71 TaxID=3072141 RepID=UPI00280E48AC|nr:outer membrane beta-barrel protein [Bradyrhizobium sp. LHD-71]MDQ8726765.1 outer membrane beta-barrel protein [Bradyrhizobium sp. LHD-71]
MSGRQEQGPQVSRRWHGRAARGPSVSLLLLALLAAEANAQTLTSDLLRNEIDGFSGNIRPLRPIDPTGANAAQRTAAAPSRIGQIPTYTVESGTGSTGYTSTGYDAFNRKRKRAARKPGVSPTVNGAAPTQILPVVVPVVPPPPRPSANAHRPPIAPSAIGGVNGQPYRRALKVDEDPFGPVGFYRGSMLVKPAVELWAGYDTNPGRINNGPSSWLYMVKPELLVTSDWERHELLADLRGSFTGYSLRNEAAAPGIPQPLPIDMDRPEFTGRVNGRIDVSRDTRILTETRFIVGTDNPGSPNIEANLKRLPLFGQVGATLGGVHSYNRFEIAAKATVDRTVYQDSTFSDGSRGSNSDRNFNAYGGTLRASYELMPHVKPFGEVTIDRRERDLEFDSNGFARSSRGRIARVGSSFELGRLITGEASVGYTTRTYEDLRLPDANGVLVAASLIWRPTGLTTVRLIADSGVGESTLPGVSGVLTRSYNAEVEHAFRRYLIAKLTAGFSTADYDGSDRFDKIYSVGGDLVYKFNREVHLKAQVRHDWLESTISDANYQATMFMLGVRLQR